MKKPTGVSGGARRLDIEFRELRPVQRRLALRRERYRHPNEQQKRRNELAITTMFKEANIESQNVDR